MRAAISPGPPSPALRRFWAAASFTHRALLLTCAAHAAWRHPLGCTCVWLCLTPGHTVPY